MSRRLRHDWPLRAWPPSPSGRDLLLRVARLRCGRTIPMGRFVIDLTHADLTGIVNGNPKARVPLFGLDLSHARLAAGKHTSPPGGSASRSPRPQPRPSTPRWEPSCSPPDSSWAPQARFCGSRPVRMAAGWCSGSPTRVLTAPARRPRRRTAWSRIAVAMPPSMAGRAGFHCRPSAGSSTNRSPRRTSR